MANQLKHLVSRLSKPTWLLLLPLLISAATAFALISFLGLAYSATIATGCIATAIGAILFRERIDEHIIRLRLPRNAYLILVWFLCILLPLVPTKYSVVALDWVQINPIAIVSAVAGISQATYFIGFGFLQAFSLGKKLRPLDHFLFSIILSLLITGAIGFVATLFNQFSLIAVPMLLIFSLVLLVKYIISSLSGSDTGHEVTVSLQFFLVFVPLVILVGVGFLMVNYPLKLVPTLDQWVHFGSALDTQQGLLFDVYPSYYWNSLFDAMILSISPLPPANTYTLLLPLSLLVIPSFFVLVRKICSFDEALLSTIVYTLFSGLAGMLALMYQIIIGNDSYLSTLIASVQTGDGITGSLSFPLFYFPKSIGLAAVFLSLLVVLKQKDQEDIWKNSILLSFTFTLAYLWHIAEALFLIILLPFLIVFIFREQMQQKVIVIGILISLMTIGLIDTIAPYAVYYISIGRTSSILVSTLILVCILMLVLIFLLRERIQFLINRTKRVVDLSLKVAVRILLVGAIFEFVVWCFIFPQINSTNLQGVIPWYLYPAKLGVSLFLALIILTRNNLLMKHSGIKLAAIISFVAFLIGRVSSLVYLRLSIHVFLESRTMDFVWPGLAILAGIAISKMTAKAKKIPKGKRSIVMQQMWTISLVLLIFVGFSTKLYEIEIRRDSVWQVMPEDVDAMAKLQELVGGYAVVAGDIHINTIRDFSTVSTLDTYSNYLLESKSVIEAAAILNYYTLTDEPSPYPRYYVSIDKFESTLSQYQGSYFIDHLLGYLPLVSNSSIDIYEIPFFAPPSEYPSILVNIPRDYAQTNSFDFLLEMLAMSNASYSLAFSDAMPLTTNVTTILSLDASISPELDTWIRNGGSLVNVNCSLFDYSNQDLLEFNSIGNAKKQLSINGRITHETTNTNGTNVLQWYMRNDVHLYPLLTSNVRGAGRILSLNLWPLFSSIAESKYQPIGRLNWRVLPSIWSFLQLDNVSSSILKSLGVAILDDSVQLTGDVVVEGSSLTFEGDCIAEYIENGSDIIWSGDLEGLSMIGNIDTTLVTSNLTLSTSRPINSIEMTSHQDITITVSLDELAEMTMILSNDGVSETTVLENGTHMIRLIFSYSNYSLNLINPMVSCIGSTSFKNIYAAKPFDVYIPGFSTTVIGSTSFRIIAAQNQIEVTDLTIEGFLDLLHENELSDISAPFNSALRDSSFVLVISFVAFVIVFLNLRGKRDRIEETLRKFIQHTTQKGRKAISEIS